MTSLPGNLDCLCYDFPNADACRVLCTLFEKEKMPVTWHHSIAPSVSSICSSLRKNYSHIESKTGLDVHFLKELVCFIESEFKEVDEDDHEQRFIVFQRAFNMVIEHVQNYKLLLTSIKKEYENVIEALRYSKRRNPTLKNQIIRLSTQGSTIHNFKVRIYQLQELLAIQRGYNKNLVKKRDELFDKSPDCLRFMEKKNVANEKDVDKRVIPGITLEQSTDINYLNTILKQVTKCVKDMNLKLKTKYVPKSEKHKLKNLLKAKITERDQLINEGHYLKAKRQRIKVGYEAALAYNDIRPPHWSVGDIVAHALRLSVDTTIGEKDNTLHAVATSTVKVLQEQEPDDEKEAELMLENIEIFNEMFENLLYAEAAMHAAVCPKGILRTMATFQRFKDLPTVPGERPSPSFIFCKALLSTVEDENQIPDEQISLECIHCTLKEREFQLLFFWLSQKKLTITKAAGDLIREYCKCSMICSCGCLSLAEFIYTQLGLYREATFALIKQNRIVYGLYYAQSLADFDSSDYEAAFDAFPTLQFASSLVLNTDSQSNTIKPLISFHRMLTLLIKKDINLLRKFWRKITHTENTNNPIVHDLISLEEFPLDESWHDLVIKLDQLGEENVAVELQALIFSHGILNSVLKTYHDQNE
ncbi:clathrin heavy chain linker domain-containing protein 1-like isoform X2 [Octopus sinensis]|uniref:Clathrin heavy chain linker domain-containing protein 1-like isoform X2 n=1 Tax=Octopus sinensis TaxID=2607531 RepID=A0A7E6EWU3_9MOLL|nr:clathrin heavy chain linker domain-containing protein 1-like isoform X2 [Octopus sinensis]